jgi:hypothetical protein
MAGFIGAILQLQLITITYHNPQSVTSLGTFRFLPGLRAGFIGAILQ